MSFSAGSKKSSKRTRGNSTRLAALLVVLLLNSVGLDFNVASAAAEASPSSEPGEGTAVTIPNARQYDLTSQINGRTYRVFVSAPHNADSDMAYPVLYVLDGNLHFATAANMVEALSPGGQLLPAIVVGIGYPTDDRSLIDSRRRFELTMSAFPQAEDPALFGGGDTFLRVLEEEVKPFVAARYKIDAERQTLYGQSLGGLMVLRQLFRNPDAYATYIAASPSIFWNGSEVLADEATFAERARAGDLHIRLLLSSAADEQYRGDDPALLAAAWTRMIDNASELADRLAALNPQQVSIRRVIFPDESHESSIPAALGRGLTFALGPPELHPE